MSRPRQPLQSVLASAIERFLAHKRALGRRYETEEYALRLLDRFMSDRGIATLDAITAELIDEFLTSRPRRRPRSFNHLLGVIRRLFDWLVAQGDITRPPALPRRRRRTSARLPFILDASQMQRLLDLAGALPDQPRAPLRGPTYRTIFGLLYGLGLRVSEVTRLELDDVDHDRRLLVIRESKFGKSRLVPFGPRMAAFIGRYVTFIEDRRGPLAPHAPLFSFVRERPVGRAAIGHVFRLLVSELEFTPRDGTRSPRVHDLRHSFAVGTLLRWYRQGLDPRQRLFHLSTFLGHVQPDSTAVYLTITEELLREAGDRFEQFAAPMVGRDTP